MVRCSEFYDKWNKSHNFCEKDPRTAGQIDAYLDELDILTKIASISKDPKYSEAIAHVTIPESALRPLIAVKDQKLHDEIAQQLVKIAVEKSTKKGKTKPTLSTNEVRRVVDQVIPKVKATVSIEQPLKPHAGTTSSHIRKYTPEQAQAFISATVDTLIEQGFGVVDIGVFFVNAMNRYPEFREHYRDEIVDKQFAAAEQEKIAAAEAKATLELIKDHEQQLRDLWKEGLNMDEIGKKLGYREIQIYNALKAMGLK